MPPEPDKKIEIQIEGMHCVSCEKSIATALEKVPLVKSAQVSFAQNKATVCVSTHFSDTKPLLQAVEESGYQASIGGGNHQHMHESSSQKSLLYKVIASSLLTLVLLVQMFADLFDVGIVIPLWLQFVLSTIVQFGFGYPFYRATFYSLKSFSINMDGLVVLGTTAAWLFSTIVFFGQFDLHLYFESSATIITLVLLGRLIEGRTKSRASGAISRLLTLTPKEALVQQDGKWVQVAVEQMQIGDLFQVKPGQAVPVDGEVVEGGSYVDESTMTGEPMPIKKEERDLLFSGTHNLGGFLIAKATAVGSKTALASIIAQVQKASESHPPIQKLVDQISAIFVPIVILISLATFALWWIFAANLEDAIVNSVTVLVVACPCALGLATPIAILVAVGQAAKLGIYVKNSDSFQKARKITHCIFDKTGTLTQGKFQLLETLGKGDVLQKVASLEALSDHPIAKILAAAEPAKLAVTEFENVSGKGVRGNIEGKTLMAGSLNWAIEYGLAPDKKLEQATDTLVVLFDTTQMYGYCTLADPIKEDALGTIKALKKRGIVPIMLTGDRRQSAEKIGSLVGIDRVFSELLPNEKAAKVNELRQKGQIVAMVGDGINDAPSLASADVSFAMRHGSDIAIESAEITIMQSDLHTIVRAIDLSKKSMRILAQNLFFAFIYNTLSIPLATAGLFNPMIAALLMSLSSLSVVLNSLRIKS